jgi:hypothetical protein
LLVLAYDSTDAILILAARIATVVPSSPCETAVGLRDTEKDATETQRHRELLRFFSVSPWLCGQFLCASQAVDSCHGLLALA